MNIFSWCYKQKIKHAKELCSHDCVDGDCIDNCCGKEKHKLIRQWLRLG